DVIRQQLIEDRLVEIQLASVRYGRASGGCFIAAQMVAHAAFGATDLMRNIRLFVVGCGIRPLSWARI
ncbi:hypothetical protein, partial [Halomonas sp. KAO]|uniref:hypothetical protein n=1 Tax=Halomonas sp. KAO TaxID=2783858 RepID=UPI001E64A594